MPNTMIAEQVSRPGTAELEQTAVPAPATGASGSGVAGKPVVFLIPGLLGTHLKAGDQRVWLDRAALAAGGFDRLALGQAAAAAAVATDGIVAASYEALITYLATTFEVIPFPYDWRLSAWDEGARLAAAVAAELHAHDRPVHILAHSVGGLVARAMIAQDPDLWAQMLGRDGRLVMLGTPNRGTYHALQLLAGDARIVRVLSLLDLRHSNDAVAAVFRTFPGLVELLPDDPALDGWNAPAWWAAQFQALLRAARRVQADLRRAETADTAHMVYVAGAAERTPAGFAIGEEGRMSYLGTGEGDGVVTYASGRMNGVPTWYMNVAHGDLAASPPGFPALVDLLLHGETGDLSLSPPARCARFLFELRETERPPFPRERDVIAAATGAAPPDRAEEEAFSLRIKVVHGSLENASHPVAVGHYHGDAIVGAERFLDGRLRGWLTQRKEMGLYPEDVGQAEVFLMPADHRPPGGMVIGLGPVGDVTPEGLTSGITEAALRLADAVARRPAEEGDGPGWRSAAFSAVLIGTQGGLTLSVEGCIAAIVKGAMLANRALRRNQWDRVRIDEVEFIELYQDVATHAARVVKEIESHLRIVLEKQERLEPAVHLQVAQGGLLQQPGTLYGGGWWRRLKVKKVTQAQAAVTQGEATVTQGQAEVPEGSLEFLLLTDRARAEESLVVTEMKLVQDLVAEMIGKPYDRDLPATLYELLMPNRLKEQAYETADLQLVLDSDAAEYPWEMLAERGQDNVPRPLATRMGMIRQLEMQQPRERIESPHDNNALVIGEPDLGGNPLFPPLPKAKEEAEVVAGLLRRQGYDVLSLIGPDAKTNAILDAFFRKDYRIIHIAGHGAYKRGDPRSTGVVIGDNRYLTAATIQQLRVVPDLVFLNCCYLARTDAGGAALPAPGQAQPAWNLLAASVSEALIRIGVRAVVAAGWAVKDEAAQFFAKEFYRLMLSDAGYGFGKAVYEARRNVLAHPDFGATTNTWGAYQCYGDPGFTLRRQARRADSAPQEPVAAHEVIRELREIERNARRLTTDDPEARRVYLERARLLARTTPRDWRNGEMLYGLAAAFGELGEFEEAIEYYREAIESPSFQEQVPLAAVEQLANLKARYADKLRRGIEDRRKAGQPDAEQDAADDAMRKALLDDAIERLERLLKVAETPERLALMGGCYKRAFTAARGAERNVAFRKGKEWYQRAHSKSLEGGKLNPYHTLNWVAFRTFQRSSSRLATRRELLDLIGRSERVVLAQPAPQRGFWDRVNLPDAAVLRALIEGNLEQRQKQILGLYREAFRQGVSSRQRNSMLQQFDFLIAAADWRDQAALAGSLRRLRDALAG